MKVSGRRLAVVSAAISLCIAASAAQADVRRGVDLWQAGNHAGAIAEWRPLAERGDKDAQFNLGQAYRLGRGVPLDIALAQTWFGRAAAQGHEQAESIFGLMLFQNGQRQQAMRWIQRSADRGDPQAQYIYGTALFNGDLAPQDWPRAFALMTRAAAQGFPPAAASLAEMERHVPLAQRQQGIELARQLERNAPAVLASVAPMRTPQVAGAQPVAAPRAATLTPPAAVPPPRSTPPAPVVRPPAPAPVAASGWRIQLGAFGSEANARRHWADVSRRASGFGGLQPYLSRAGNLTRLQAGPVANRAAAVRLCAAAQAAGAACFPVAP